MGCENVKLFLSEPLIRCLGEYPFNKFWDVIQFKDSINLTSVLGFTTAYIRYHEQILTWMSLKISRASGSAENHARMEVAARFT